MRAGHDVVLERIDDPISAIADRARITPTTLLKREPSTFGDATQSVFTDLLGVFGDGCLHASMMRLAMLELKLERIL